MPLSKADELALEKAEHEAHISNAPCSLLLSLYFWDRRFQQFDWKLAMIIERLLDRHDHGIYKDELWEIKYATPEEMTKVYAHANLRVKDFASKMAHYKGFIPLEDGFLWLPNWDEIRADLAKCKVQP